VLDVLQAEGLLSDARYAEAYVAARSARGFGPVRIVEELKQRGVPADARDAACPRDDAHWTALAAAAREKRFGAALPQDFRERARQARFLAQRGFASAQIAAALHADPQDL
jgi:regulatory protein